MDHLTLCQVGMFLKTQMWVRWEAVRIHCFGSRNCDNCAKQFVKSCKVVSILLASDSTLGYIVEQPCVKKEMTETVHCSVI